MATNYIPHSMQGGLVKKLSDDDIIIVSVDDSSTETEKLTANTKLQAITDATYKGIRENTSRKIMNVREGYGLLGDGSIYDPLRVDIDVVGGGYVLSALTSVAQVGKVGTKLPIRSNALNPVTFTVTADIKCFIAGVGYTIPSGTSVAGTGTGKQWLYAVVKNKTISLVTSASSYGVTKPTAVFIGTRDTSQVINNSYDAIAQFNNVELSSKMSGQATPTSGEHVGSPAGTAWGISTVAGACGLDISTTIPFTSVNKNTSRVKMKQGPQTVTIRNYLMLSRTTVGCWLVSADPSSPLAPSIVYVNGNAVRNGIGIMYDAVDITPYLREGVNIIDTRSSNTDVKLFCPLIGG